MRAPLWFKGLFRNTDGFNKLWNRCVSVVVCSSLATCWSNFKSCQRFTLSVNYAIHRQCAKGMLILLLMLLGKCESPMITSFMSLQCACWLFMAWLEISVKLWGQPDNCTEILFDFQLSRDVLLQRPNAHGADMLFALIWESLYIRACPIHYRERYRKKNGNFCCRFCGVSCT